METIYDFVTVAAFLALMIIFLLRTDRSLLTLKHMMVSCLALAVANQAGNAGYLIMAWALIIAVAFHVATLSIR